MVLMISCLIFHQKLFVALHQVFIKETPLLGLVEHVVKAKQTTTINQTFVCRTEVTESLQGLASNAALLHIIIQYQFMSKFLKAFTKKSC